MHSSRRLLGLLLLVLALPPAARAEPLSVERQVASAARAQALLSAVAGARDGNWRGAPELLIFLGGGPHEALRICRGRGSCVFLSPAEVRSQLTMMAGGVLTGPLSQALETIANVAAVTPRPPELLEPSAYDDGTVAFHVPVGWPSSLVLDFGARRGAEAVVEEICLPGRGVVAPRHPDVVAFLTHVRSGRYGQATEFMSERGVAFRNVNDRIFRPKVQVSGRYRRGEAGKLQRWLESLSMSLRQPYSQYAELSARERPRAATVTVGGNLYRIGFELEGGHLRWTRLEYLQIEGD